MRKVSLSGIEGVQESTAVACGKAILAMLGEDESIATDWGTTELNAVQWDELCAYLQRRGVWISDGGIVKRATLP